MEMDPSIIFQNIVSYGISRENYFFFPILSLYGDIQRNKYNKTCDLQLDF